jgi:hypothetical protein
MKQGRIDDLQEGQNSFLLFPAWRFPIGGRHCEDMFLRFSIFEASLVVRGSTISKNLNRFLQGEGNKVSQVKRARITHFNFFFSTFFTTSSAHGVDSQRFATTAPAKVTAQNVANRAGATPLFRLPPAQKVRGVAPALATKARI